MCKKFKKSSVVLLTLGMMFSQPNCFAVLPSEGKFKSSSEELHITQNIIEKTDTEIMEKIRSKLGGLSEMHPVEQDFLNGIIRKYKPKKILELGVSAGGSSAILLNASKDIEGSKVFSIDKLSYYYRDPKKPVGYVVNEIFPELMDRWKLYKDGIACDFIDEIGGDIDFCLIDTVHARPGEIADFLSILPYLKKDAVVCFHDIGASFSWGLEQRPAYYSNDILFSSIKGEKMLPKTEYLEFFSNIGAIKLNSEQKKSLIDYFFLFTTPWQYIPENSDNEKLIKHFERHYDKEVSDMYKKGLAANIKYHDKIRI